MAERKRFIRRAYRGADATMRLAQRRMRDREASAPDELQAMLGALSKNRTLEIFQQITAELLGTLAPRGDARRKHGAEEALARAELRKAMQALLAHDHDAANEAMQRRLRALSHAITNSAQGAPRRMEGAARRIRA